MPVSHLCYSMRWLGPRTTQLRALRPANLSETWNQFTRQASSLSNSAPRIAQPSLWKSLVPKPLRSGSSSPAPDKMRQRKEWNPFIVYMVIFMLIGSNAINMIGLRNEILNFSQKTDRQIALLKEVIRKVQNGEKVDIEAALGTGNAENEKDWEEALKEIESNDTLYNNEKRKAERKASAARGADKLQSAVPGANDPEVIENAQEAKPKGRFGFY